MRRRICSPIELDVGKRIPGEISAVSPSDEFREMESFGPIWELLSDGAYCDLIDVALELEPRLMALYRSHAAQDHHLSSPHLHRGVGGNACQSNISHSTSVRRVRDTGSGSIGCRSRNEIAEILASYRRSMMVTLA